MKLTPFAAFLGLFSLLLTFAAPVQAQAPETPQKSNYTHIRLFSPATAVGDTETVAVAVEVVMAEGWKIYWRTPGDSGLPPTFDWTGSQNLQSHTIKWPVPYRFTMYDIDNIGYKNSVIFPIDITPAAKGEALDLKLKMDLLVCSDICVPETHTATLSLPAGLSEASGEMPLYAAALEHLPAPAEGAIGFEKAWLDYDSSNRNYLVVEMTGIEKPGTDADLFVEHPTAQIVFGKPQIKHDEKTGRTVFRALAHTTEPLEAIEEQLKQGDMTFTYANGDKGIEGTGPLAPRPAAAPVKGPAVTAQLAQFEWRILIAALIGGLILNLMPCVLPVLSLKVLSVVSHGGKDSRAVIFKNFMASAAGIIFSFWVIAAGLVLLKNAGETIGWGIQFQNPVFLVFLLVIVLLFAANMWGLFEIPLPRFIAHHVAGKKGDDEPTLLGHFLTGAFATLLATPCTAPFLGTAIGFALARGAFEIFTIFTFLGIGLALPYILLAVSPRVFKYMPKPGKWMVSLRKILALALVATAVWLGSILFSITATPALDRGWEKFDAARIAPEVELGHTVIVDVTADWCLTCKANKRFVLETREVTDALSAENIVRLQADWTQRDADIAAYLQSFGKYGIPFNVVYGPAAPEGIVLPELLTRDAVLDALTEAAGE